ncbi:Endonuclease III [Moritella yayanosii]|uniref:Endonuclease III n=1 Tax=Moritella yayanosii TaxID=69539 RepID=A0A330LIE0_9GAMM|nr:Endonuclease III [Moritella yayanosii]
MLKTTTHNTIHNNLKAAVTTTFNDIFTPLQQHYGHLAWWPADTEYEMMVGAILTQNTNWKNVEKALAILTGKLTPQQILAMPVDTLARRIEGATLRNELLAVNGIGPETADSILVYALDKPFFIIDNYTRRILHRIGFELPTGYDQLRLLLEQNIPRNITTYQQYHALLVEHAKRYCTKIPQCQHCPLSKCCQKRIK